MQLATCRARSQASNRSERMTTKTSDWNKLEVGGMGWLYLPELYRQAGTVAGSGAPSGSLGECPINV